MHKLNKYYMLHYTPTEGNVFHYFKTPEELLKALVEKYQRTLQTATIYAVFWQDENGVWHGESTDYHIAIERLTKFINERGTKNA